MFKRIFVKNKELTFEENCYSFLLGNYYASLKQKIKGINKTIDNKGNKMFSRDVEMKLLRLKKSLDVSFIGKCELIK